MVSILNLLNPYRKKLFIANGVLSFTLLLLIIFTYTDLQEEKYSEKYINEVSDELVIAGEEHLNHFANILFDAKNELKNGGVSISSISELDQFFSTKLESNSQITSFFLGSSSGEQYLIYMNNSSFVSGIRIADSNKNKIEWRRWDKNKNTISKWYEIIELGQEKFSWFNKISLGVNDSIKWSDIHQFVSNKKYGITALVDWVDSKSNDTLYCSINIDLSELLGYFSNVDKFDDRSLFLISEDKLISNIPEKGNKIYTDSPTGLSANKYIDNDNIEVILSELKKLGNIKENPFSFSKNDILFWAKLSTLSINKSNLKIGFSIDEDELIWEETYYKRIIYACVFLVLAIQVLFVAYLFYKKRNYHKILEEVQVWKEYSEEEIASLISKGENSGVEFKSSLRWDYREEKVNKHLEEVILKSVAAFNNGNGGTLFIGVDDDGNVLGLENDYQSLKKKNIDYFEIHIRNLFNQIFGINYTTTNLKISFPKFNEKYICIIEISKGERPIFLTLTDTKGRKSENFFIRSGNTSQKIESLTEINEYILERFKATS